MIAGAHRRAILHHQGPGERERTGLAAVFGCVKGHGWRTSPVTSAPGHGTTFTLLLRSALPADPEEFGRSAPPALARAERGSGR
jgi:hypothetical protein